MSLSGLSGMTGLSAGMGQGDAEAGFSSDFENILPLPWHPADSTLSLVAFNRPGSAGTQCMRVTDTGAILYPCSWVHPQPVTPGAWYSADGWTCKRTAPGSCILDVRDSATRNTSLSAGAGNFTANVWKHCIVTFKVPSDQSAVAVHFAGPTTTTGQYFDLDDFVFSRLSTASLFANSTTMTSAVTATVQITHTGDTTALGWYDQSGVACNVDSMTNPKNMVLAHMDWNNLGTGCYVILEKCVNGTWTTLLNVNITYALGGDLQLCRVGNVYTVYYNGLSLGSATVSDASIISNTTHCTFQTDSHTILSNFTVVNGQGAIKIDVPIQANNDDGRWKETSGVLDTTSGPGPFGYWDGTQGRANAYTRYIGVQVPQGKTIVAASVSLYASATNANATVNALVDAVKAVNPAAPTTYAGAETATRTTANVAWSNVPAWTVDTKYVTPDISTVIQELVNQASWVAGNAMLIYIEDNGSTATSFTYRSSKSYEGGPSTQVANLHIEYTP